MDLISSIKQAFTRRTYTEADMDRLIRFAKYYCPLNFF